MPPLEETVTGPLAGFHVAVTAARKADEQIKPADPVPLGATVPVGAPVATPVVAPVVSQ